MSSGERQRQFLAPVYALVTVGASVVAFICCASTGTFSRAVFGATMFGVAGVTLIRAWAFRSANMLFQVIATVVFGMLLVITFIAFIAAAGRN